ncbi:MAG: AMP-dependent synthetase/ligase [candidate division Zixibacteria bacterium]|nr:AMP-dependent synthetase/ligase [candidate division Zixibacteria bacterium]
MTFQEFLTEIKDCTLPQLLEKASQRYEDLPFLCRFENEKITGYSFREVYQMAFRLAAGLKKLGVGRGDRVGLLSENRPEWGISYLGIQAAGAAVVPMDPSLKPQEISQIFEMAEMKGLIISGKFFGPEAEPVRQIWEKYKLACVVNLDGEAAGKSPVGWKTLVSGPEMAPQPSIKPDDLAALIFTSGTMSTSKGVMLTHKNLVTNIWSVLSVFDCTPADTFLSVLPLAHTYESTGGFLMPLGFGARVVTARSLKSKELVEDIQRSGATFILGVPLLFQKMAEGLFRGVSKKGFLTYSIFKLLFKWSRRQIGKGKKRVGIVLFKSFRHKAGLGSLRVLVSGGAALPPKIAEDFLVLGIPLLQGYGLTETAPVLSVNPVDVYKVKPASVGPPLPGVQFKIDSPDEAGHGEILAKGENVMAGYYKNPSATGAVLDEEGWFHTGDVGYLDYEGYLHISGRCKNIIVTPGGKNVCPEEVEGKLLESPFISEALVLGRRNPELHGEEIEAIVVPNREYFEAAAIQTGESWSNAEIESKVRAEVRRLSDQLADYKRVQHIALRWEEFEKTYTRKIKRHLFASLVKGFSQPVRSTPPTP